MKKIALPLIIFLVMTNHARAGCSSPAGTAGTMEYFTAENTFKFCNDTDWIDMGASGGGGAVSLSCSKRNATLNVLWGQVNCQTGEKVTGGGCAAGNSSTNIYESYPTGNGWSCRFTSASGSNIIYAVCCTIQ